MRLPTPFDVPTAPARASTTPTREVVSGSRPQPTPAARSRTLGLDKFSQFDFPTRTVSAIRETYHLGSDVKFHGANLLGGFRRPSAEALLLELLDHEQDLNARSWLITALCDMGTTEGLERLRPLNKGVDYLWQWTEYLDRSIAIIERIRTRYPAAAASLEADILRGEEEERLRKYQLAVEAGLYR